MDKTTKICITAIIITLIWFLAQPIGGRMSFEANLDHVPYLNLTNSTISGHAEISGYMPMGTFVPVILIDFLDSLGKVSFTNLLISFMIISGICLIFLIIHLTIRIIKIKKE